MNKNEQNLEDIKDSIYQEAYFQHYLIQFPMKSKNEIDKLFNYLYKSIEIFKYIIQCFSFLLLDKIILI